MKHDNKRNDDIVFSFRTVGGSNYDMDYICTSSTDNTEITTGAPPTVAHSDTTGWFHYVCNFFIERANDAFCISPKRLIFTKFFERIIK